MNELQIVTCDVTPQPFPLKDFLRTYNDLGTWLHRGTLERISKPVPAGHVENMEGPGKIANDLVQLLRCHRVMAGEVLPVSTGQRR
jgi:hypothetical protein